MRKNNEQLAMSNEQIKSGGGKHRDSKKVLLFAICYLLFAICTAHTQSATQSATQSTAAEIETLLQTNAITYAQAARVILDASNTLTTRRHETAFNYAMEQNWLPKNAAADQTARLDTVSLLCVRAFEIKGGLMFSLTKRIDALAANYAYRELCYLNAIHGRVWPSMEVSGSMLLFMVNRLLDSREEITAVWKENNEESGVRNEEDILPAN